MTFLSNVLAFLVVIGVIVFVHELGHFLAARLFRIRVRVFSVGIGSRIWGFRRGDTEYRLAMIPLGGYVAFSGIDAANPTGDAGDFIAKPRWQRIIVLLAGPAANVVLSIVLIAAVLMTGTELAGPRDLSTEIGGVAPESAAAEAGLMQGDVILRLDGEDVPDWRALSNAVLMSAERRLAVDFERGGESLSTVLVPRRMPRYELGDAGLYASLLPRVRQVFENSPAEQAGLRYGDTLYAVDGHPVANAEDFRRLVEPRAGEEVSLEIGRGDDRLAVAVRAGERGRRRPRRHPHRPLLLPARRPGRRRSPRARASTGRRPARSSISWAACSTDGLAAGARWPGRSRSAGSAVRPRAGASAISSS